MAMEDLLSPPPLLAFRAEPFKLGLCLSGGGLRATFFHLGVIRALRETQGVDGKHLLGKVTHICSVSGGSILAAHLVLNWEQYIGSWDDYAAAEAQLLDFGKRDVRGRVVRRWLLAGLLFPLRAFPRLSRRTQLLQREYHRLYQGAKLEDLKSTPQTERPDLHILSTSLTTGDLYSFSQTGLTISDKPEAKPFPLGSEALALAVAASSAFPPLFPPVRVTRARLGASTFEMPHAQDYLTDGGVYDNLGVTKFASLINSGKAKLDAVLVVDAGASFDWDVTDQFSWITSRTSRSTEIMMRLVAEASLRVAHPDTFGSQVYHLSIRDQLTSSSWASLPPEYRIRTKRIRTDLDKFSGLEIETLMQHGYEVCMKHIYAGNTPSRMQGPMESAKEISKNSSPINVSLLDAAARRRWRVFSFHDWVSLPLAIVAALVVSISVLSIVGFPLVLRREAAVTAEENTLRSTEDALLSAIKEGPRTLTPEYLAEFRRFFSRLNLRHLNPEQFLVLGAANSVPNTPAYGLNTYPPRELWPNIERTMIIADEFVSRYGAAITINAAYRTAPYARAIGGTRESAHVLFYAVDFRVEGKGTPAEWASVLRSLRSEGRFRGGIGQYPGFVHVDTRGPDNKDWPGFPR